jgi:hypothetical protein
VHLLNNTNCEPEYEQFVLADPAEGRLKRIVNYDAAADCPMKLKQFPFNHQIIEAHFVIISPSGAL